MTQAQLAFGTVHHRRLRPVAHSFNHRVYFLRLPMRGGFGGSRWFSRNHWNLLSFHDADHGDGHTPLLPWIEDLLRRHHIHDADGEIWLQTFPRVLGYVFNPVSFWFCHRADGSLRAVLCEVNNTFGERHGYLLQDASGIANGQELTAVKVFHVSPFCTVEGGYRFRFHHHVRGETQDVLACIDHDDAQGALLRTHIAGQALPLTDRAVLRAFFGFPLMTFMVIARIHWHALRLWLKRVPFHRKPIPPTKEISS